MTYNELKTKMTPQQLATLGEGAIAYMREMDATELKGKFPGMPDIEAGTRLWALFAANGMPILLADGREAALAGAFQNDLQAVSIH